MPIRSQGRRVVATGQLTGEHPVQSGRITRPERPPTLPGYALSTRVKPSWRWATNVSRPVKRPCLSQATTDESPASSGRCPGLARGHEGKARLKPERVTRSEASRRGARCDERFPEVGCTFCWYRALDAVLAGVAGACHRYRHPLPVQLFDPEAADLGRLGESLAEGVARPRP